MTDLRPCPQCHRHVAITERACPFCARSLVASLPRDQTFKRVSRAAVFAGAALASTACGGKKKPDTTVEQNTATADAGVSEQTPSDRTDRNDPNNPNNVPMPYGAPPSRRRVV